MKQRSEDLIKVYQHRVGNFQGEDCPACGAQEKPAPHVGRGATQVIHSEDCDFIAWMDEEDALAEAEGRLGPK